MKQDPMNPITEDDIANYLANSPDFFERHAELLSQVQLTSPHGNRAVSLQERQAENMLISERVQRWARSLFLVQDPRALPGEVVLQIASEFMVPQVGIKVWGVDPAHADTAFAQGVSDDAKAFASSLTQPYCGVNSGFEAVNWLDDSSVAMSIALLPLRAGAINSTGPAFGMLVLASPDPQRFHAGMGTDFLARIGQLASAALSRLR
jgi:uncharacterized protein YigA (DUF484 family)